MRPEEVQELQLCQRCREKCSLIRPLRWSSKTKPLCVPRSPQAGDSPVLMGCLDSTIFSLSGGKERVLL